MRDRGLDEAIRAVGGVSELARRLGISQPSVSKWESVPAERVLSIEATTGIPRATLRPDLFASSEAGVIDDVETARAQEYALLSTLLARSPDAALLKRLSHLTGDATPIGSAHRELAAAAQATDEQQLEREYFELFIGLGRGELLPYGSYYLSGFLHDRPLARLRADLRRIGVEAAADQSEPEDHAALLCEVMARLAARQFEAPREAEREIFSKHVASWMGRFFADLERARSARFYARVGALGRVFIAIETEAFALPG
jgi:TorA maturation chaperone TorD